jgi:NADH dehydrogenase FAD-containing subunit
VEKIVPSKDDPSTVGGVVVNGEEIAADVVVFGVGVSPATEFLKSSGLETQKDGGVEVDEFLKVKGREGVYAIGENRAVSLVE